MHRAVGCCQGWKFSNYLVGLSRTPWVCLSDGAGTFIQGTSCAKSRVSVMKTKFSYPVESVVFKASVPVARRQNAATNVERRRIVPTASLQTGRSAKGKLADCKLSGGRYLSSKRLIESAFRVLLDLKNEKISIGLFRLGRSASSENSVLASAHAGKHSAGQEFEWSSALWEAEILNAAEDETLSNGIPVNTEVNPADKSLDNTRETENGSHVAVALVNGVRDTSLCNASDAEIIERATGAIAAVNLEPADSSVLDTHDTTAQQNEVQKKDTGAESMESSEHHSKSSAGANSAAIEQPLVEVVESSFRDPFEDGGQAYPYEASEQSVQHSDTPAVGQTGGREMEKKLEKLKKLREAVASHAYRYYTLDDPIISDSAYDALVNEMKQVEASTVGPHDSGPFMVGAPSSPRMLKVQHIVPMLSLASVQKEEELVSWHQRLEQRLGTTREPVEWVVEPKVDGLALSLRYENGKLVCASTRGNGIEGEDVTHNAQKVQNIPLEIPQQLPGSRISSIDVRGEIYMPLTEFDEVNTLKLRAGEKPFANPRNAAAGSMRLLSSQNFDHRRLTFVAYNIANIALTESEREVSETSPQSPLNQWEALQLLKSLGFFVNEDNHIFDSFDSALDYAKRWMTKRQSLGYEADGVVFKVNDRRTQVLLGSIGGNPRWAVAWKFAGTEVVTILEAIELTVGRTGVIVPNARLKPVELGGVLLRRASLHNFKHVKNLGLCEGDHVIVRRAGDVIPQIVLPVEESRLSGASPWVPPAQCPSCGSELKEEPLKAMVFCRNSNCSSRRSRQVEHYAKTLIDGLGPKILTQLQEEGLVVDVADLYSLNEAALSGLPRFGTKSARKLLSAILESKSKPNWEFIAALGIPRVGIGIAQRLDEHLGGLQGLLNASDDQLLSVPGVGEQTLRAVFDWCRCETNIGLVSELLAAGCAHASSQLSAGETQVPKSVETAVSSYIAGPDTLECGGADQPERSVERLAKVKNSEESRTPTDIASQPKLLGKTVVVTGSFGQGDREYMHYLVRSHGGKVRSSVTSKTSFVLAGANPGPNKIVACKQLGIEVLDWEKFQHLVQGP